MPMSLYALVRGASCRLGNDWRAAQWFFDLSRAPQFGVNVREKHARITVLVIAALACGTESGKHYLVCVGWSSWGDFAG